MLTNPHWFRCLNATRCTLFRGSSRFELENYFPEAHYKLAVDQAEGDDVLLDSGSRTQYYWSGDGGAVYRTEGDDKMVDPFFGSVEEAERYLEDLADVHGCERYENLVLRKSGNPEVVGGNRGPDRAVRARPVVM